jgi:cell wall-associated NlpC family hydrolase
MRGLINMITTNRIYPSFSVDLITEATSYELTFDTGQDLNQSDFEQAILSFSVKNSMADDSPVFSLILLAKEKWDNIINSNDLIRIRVTPDVSRGVPDNPYIMVGLISDIRRDGEYDNGTLVYRITGRAMTKALIDFEVGVLQELPALSPEVGWLPDDTENGLKFSGNTASGIAEELMENFVYKYAEYNFSGGKKLKDYLTHHFTSWTEDESLADVTPYINYEGSIRQFLEDVSAKPFNELFFEFTKDGMCVAFMRPTPFDKKDWNALATYRFTSDIVIEESFGRSDAEMYSVYVVQAPNLVELNSVDLGVYPKFHPDLIKKYGYRRLDAENQYLLSGTLAGITDEGEEVSSGFQAPPFEDVLKFLDDNKYTDAETLRKQRDLVYSELQANFPTLTKGMTNGIIDSLKEGDFTPERYTELKATVGTKGSDKEANKEKDVATEKLEKYTQRLFNWYCENANFYSGDIRVLGNPAYRVGSRLFYEDFEKNTTWEFYVESVQHEFSFTSGYTTIIGVTRGLPDGGATRFTNLWGQSQEFLGGYMGEDSILELVKKAQEANAKNANTTGDSEGSGSWGGGSGSGGAMGALATAREMATKKSIYVFGGGRTGQNPFLQSPIRIDCSSFVWWCYYLNGITLKGGKTGMTTDTIAVDPQLTTVSTRGSAKAVAGTKVREGDLVYFDTYKQNGHIGIYTGNGKFIGAQSSSGIKEEDMTKGYWWDKFNGHIKRLQ